MAIKQKDSPGISALRAEYKQDEEWHSLQKQWWQEKIPQWQKNIPTFSNVCNYTPEQWQAVQDSIMPYLFPYITKPTLDEIADKIGEIILDYQCENLRQDTTNDFLRLKENEEHHQKLKGYLKALSLTKEAFTTYEGLYYTATEGMERSKRPEYYSALHEILSSAENFISTHLGAEVGRPPLDTRSTLIEEISKIWKEYTGIEAKYSPRNLKETPQVKFARNVAKPILTRRDRLAFDRALETFSKKRDTKN